MLRAEPIQTITHLALPLKTPFRCPICNGGAIIEDIDEVETDTGKITEGGLHLSCSSQPDIDDDEWEKWLNWHFSTPYIDWLPIQEPVLNWFNEHFRYV